MHFRTSGFSQGVEDQWRLTADRVKEWVENELFSVSWWILLALFLVCAYLWWKTADKKRLGETALFTASAVIFIIVLDEVGEELALWYYSADIIPLFPPMSAINLSCLPFAYALIYGKTKTWKSFLITMAVMSVLFCFVIEPLFVWGGFYKMLAWKHWYGVPLYFAIGAASKFIVRIAYRPTEKKKAEA